MSEYYAKSNSPASASQLSSAVIRAEFAAIEAGTDKLPTMTGNGNALVVVNPTGTALTALGLSTGYLTWSGSAWVWKNESYSLSSHDHTGVYATAAHTHTSIAATGPSTISVSSASAALTITQTGAGNALVVEDATSPDSTPFVIDANGYVVSGTTQAYNIGGFAPMIQAHTTNVLVNAPSAVIWSNDNQGAITLAAKSRGGIGTQTIVQSGDSIGQTRYLGSDGTAFIEAARISASIDGTPGTNDMPGRLVFSTTADGASTPTERMRIDSTGKTTFKFGVQETKVAIGASDIDLSLGNVFTKTISTTTTLTVSNVPATGTVAAFVLDLTNGGSSTVTWWANIKWVGGIAPTLTASGRDVVFFLTHDGGATWNGFIQKDVK